MKDGQDFTAGLSVGFAIGSVISFKLRGRLEKWRKKGE